MIRFTLQCAEGHRFESWFRDSSAFDALADAGELVCPTCGSRAVEKSLMTPQVRPARKAAPDVPTQSEPTTEPAPPSLTAETDHDRALAALKAKVEAEADYVGEGFAKQARAMHDGTEPERPIYGEAKPDEARALLEDGVPVAPLPFTPTRKVN